MVKNKLPANVFQREFSVGFKTQAVWGVPHASWFFAMGIGGGLYFIRFLGLSIGELFGLPLLDVIAIVLILIGGNILIADLGRPSRFIKAFRKPGRAWIARGAIADFVFGIVGTMAIIPQFDIGFKPFSFLPWTMNSWFGILLQLITAGSALVVITYAGFVLADSPSIPAWHTRLVPTQFLIFGISGAFGLYFLSELILGTGSNIKFSELIGSWIAFLNLLATIAYTLQMRRSLPAARESMRELTAGRYAVYYVGGVLLLGLALPSILLPVSYFTSGTVSVAAMGIAGATLLISNFLFRFSLLRTGMYGPYIKLEALLGGKGSGLVAETRGYC